MLNVVHPEGKGKGKGKECSNECNDLYICIEINPILCWFTSYFSPMIRSFF